MSRVPDGGYCGYPQAPSPGVLGTGLSNCVSGRHGLPRLADRGQQQLLQRRHVAVYPSRRTAALPVISVALSSAGSVISRCCIAVLFREPRQVTLPTRLHRSSCRRYRPAPAPPGNYYVSSPTNGSRVAAALYAGTAPCPVAPSAWMIAWC